ncbi:MAG: BBP7 family outer membrane beta-barrel protein [Planctomycetia bacterium]|nr:BBP7 family outer membrane beta-barrel protein [Planctomycetia bacterium]
MPLRTTVFVCTAFVLATAMNASAQNVSPPPGFSPSAPASPGGVNPPGVLERLGGTSPARRFDDPAADVSNPGDSYQPPASTAPYQSHEMHPGQGYSHGTWVPPESHAMLQSPSVYAARFWIKAEALYWWTKASPLPVPVITAGSPFDPIPGALGQPGTQVIIGNENIGLPGRGGGRFTLGFALDREAQTALEGNYFFLTSVTAKRGVSSDGFPGSPLLALPFSDPTLPGENSTFIANPGAFSGTAVVTLQSFVQGAEANLLLDLSNAAGWRWEGLAGFRYLNLQEILTLSTDSPNVPPNLPDFFSTFDRFSAQNNFYGGQIGARATYENPYLFFNGTAKLAIGSTIENVTASGALFSSGGSAPGAYLTQPTNLGSVSQSQFALVPGVDLNFGVRLSPWASVIVGYSFLYVSSVARPGDQIDRVINPSQAPGMTGVFPGSLSGPARPTLVVHDTDFWVQGLTFSLELRY